MLETHAEHTFFKDFRTPHLLRKLVVTLLLCACVCIGAWGADYQYATISKVPATELDWGTASNWETGTPYTAGIPSITNNNTYTITLNSDMKITGNFDIGSTSDNAITLTINLNGYNLSVSGTFNQNNKNPVNIKGPGTFSMNGYDLDGSYNHSLNLSNGAVVDIQNSMYTNGTPVTITDKDGTCTLYLPAGGQNTNYGAGQLTQSNITAIPSANTKNPVYTFAVASTQNPTGTTFDYTITVKNTIAGNSIATSTYKVELLKNNPGNTITYTTDNAAYSVDKTDFSYTLDQNTINSTTIRIYSSSALEENEGVRITVMTPDKTMPLGVFEYIYKKWSWNGSVDTVWEKKENWTYNGILAAGATGVPGVSDSVSIPSGCSHYPEIGASSSVQIQNVTIMPGAHITQTGGTFQVNRLTIDGSGVYSATGGTVQFVPYGGNAPAWICDYPINSKLYNVEIPSGVTFQPSSDMYITGNLTATGTFDAASTGKTLFVVPADTSRLKGSISTIKLGKLDVSTTSSGKAFYLDGSLSTSDISVKGTLNALITVDGAAGSYIQLAADKSGGEYIQFASASVPEIKGKTYTVTSAIPVGGSVPSGWSYTAPATATWTGASSTDWSDSANWSPVQIPTGEIIIPKNPTGGKYPQLSVDIKQKAAIITVEEGASLNLNEKTLEAFSITNHGALNVGTGTLSVTDLTHEKAGLSDPGITITSGTIQATSSITNKAELSISSGNWYSNALINDISGAMTLQTGSSLTLKDFINRGTLTIDSEPTKMEVNGERQNAADSLVEYTAANPTLSWGDVYEKVQFDSSLTVGAGNSWSITQAKEITFADAVTNAGTMALTADEITFKKSVTNSSTGTLALQAGTTTFSAGVTNQKTLTSSGNLFFTAGVVSSQGAISCTGEIHFAGTAAQNVAISTTSTIGEVVVDARAKPTLTGNLTCAGLTIESTGSFDIGSNELTVSGGLTNSGTFSSSAGGKVTLVKGFSNTGTITLNGKTTFSGGTPQPVSTGASSVFADVTVSGAGGISLQSDCTFAKLTVTNGGIALGSRTLTVTGDWIHSGGNITASTGGKAVCNGTMTVSASVSIAGNNAWNNLTCTTPGVTLQFAGGSTQTVNGTLTVTGGSASGSEIILSSTDTTNWNLAMGSTPTSTNLQLSYVTVSFSTARPAIYSVIGEIGTNGVLEGTEGSTVGWFYVVPEGIPVYFKHAYAPYGGSTIYVAFSRRIDVSSAAVLSQIPLAVELRPYADAGADNIIASGSPAAVISDDDDGTVISLTLSTNVTLNHLTTYSLFANGDSTKRGYIHDTQSPRGELSETTIALSPLVTGAAFPAMAYDNRTQTDEVSDGSTGVIRLFDGSGSTLNSVLGGNDITLQAKTDNDALGLKLLVTQDEQADTIFQSNPVVSGEAAEQFISFAESILAENRIKTNSSSGKNRNFIIPASLTMDISKPLCFFFQLLDSNGAVLTNAKGIPLYVVRSPEDDASRSLSVWSVTLREIIQQKGGVTILNNVINALKGEETVIEIDVSKRSSVTVQVLTLDGNVVKTLQRGVKEAGKYYFRWNGTNKNGASVARGMYFIRVTGGDFDATRKVMVIRE